MKVRIGFVLELPRHEPAVGFGQLHSLLHHSDRALGGWRGDDFRAKKTHQSAPFDAEGLRHRQDQRIAFRGADHGEPDAGIAARRLDDGLARLQLAGLLCGLDHAQRQPVLDGAERIERLDLHIEVDPVRREAIDPYDGRMSDRLAECSEIAPCEALRRLPASPDKAWPLQHEWASSAPLPTL